VADKVGWPVRWYPTLIAPAELFIRAATIASVS